MAPAICFNGVMHETIVNFDGPGGAEDNSGEFGVPKEKWTGPPPPTAERAEIVELPKPKTVHRYTITADELATLERVAWAVLHGSTRTTISLYADSAISVARKVRGE